MTLRSHPTNWRSGFAVRIGKWKFYNYAPKWEIPNYVCSAGFYSPTLGCHNLLKAPCNKNTRLLGFGKTTVVEGSLKLEMSDFITTPFFLPVHSPPPGGDILSKDFY